ncbi:hypothetical protein BO78DRAFT_22252 [Aspergillus sclerotiicarbonarius CBS 121057]|uniref:Uncharacterized protein n=1 Tax=Aspergillus sclerotiicarbonarius (strain CBS 121057 / IBT 28362) TaxID=1448318 RepID=A0A319EY22_ASPSB|nr:hypothetical protein BO78DRAFT_22252 [Aspergillus sclerotiicarbonarius CBS 121057]
MLRSFGWSRDRSESPSTRPSTRVRYHSRGPGCTRIATQSPDKVALSNKRPPIESDPKEHIRSDSTIRLHLPDRSYRRRRIDTDDACSAQPGRYDTISCFGPHGEVPPSEDPGPVWVRSPEIAGIAGICWVISE